MPMFLLLCGLIIIFTNKVSASNDFSVYETVNSKPQVQIGQEHFLAYWAVWRGLRPLERVQLLSFGPGERHLISKRDIRWEAKRCADTQILSNDSESFYFDDPIEFLPDGSGRILPLREAMRTDYRYFVMFSINSQYLPSQQERVPLRRQSEETEDEFFLRKSYPSVIGSGSTPFLAPMVFLKSAPSIVCMAESCWEAKPESLPVALFLNLSLVLGPAVGFILTIILKNIRRLAVKT